MEIIINGRIGGPQVCKKTAPILMERGAKNCEWSEILLTNLPKFHGHRQQSRDSWIRNEEQFITTEDKSISTRSPSLSSQSGDHMTLNTLRIMLLENVTEFRRLYLFSWLVNPPDSGGGTVLSYTDEQANLPCDSKDRNYGVLSR